MRATVEREEALRLLQTEHQAVGALIAELTDEEMTRRDTIQQGMYYDQECSFKDLLAHLICYEVYTVEAISEWRNSRKHWAIEAVQGPAARARDPLRRHRRPRPSQLGGAARRVSDGEPGAGARNQ